MSTQPVIHSLRCTRTAGAAVAVAALAHVTIRARRQVRRVRSAMQTVPPQYRLPALYLFDQPHTGRPPRRHPVLERALARAVPSGIGQPVTVPARADAPPVPAYVYDPPGRTRPSGALLWVHGGGMVSGGPWMDHALCTRIARELGILVLSVDYRLAPEHPFPAGPDDCYAALAWLHERAGALGVDRARVGVAGASAGGGLAAVVAQMAHDRGLPLAVQALVYPMLDDRTTLRGNHGTRGALVWTPAKNRDAWGWFLGHPVGSEEERPYASAARREDLSGLAPAWVGVGDADLFHDEDLEYARRLREAGVAVELLVVPGMPHAADMADAAESLPAMREFRSSLIAALGETLSSQPGPCARSPEGPTEVDGIVRL